MLNLGLVKNEARDTDVVEKTIPFEELDYTEYNENLASATEGLAAMTIALEATHDYGKFIPAVNAGYEAIGEEAFDTVTDLESVAGYEASDNIILKTLKKIWDGITYAIKQIWKFIKRLFSSVIDFIKNFFKSLGSSQEEYNRSKSLEKALEEAKLSEADLERLWVQIFTSEGNSIREDIEKVVVKTLTTEINKSSVLKLTQGDNLRQILEDSTVDMRIAASNASEMFRHNDESLDRILQMDEFITNLMKLKVISYESVLETNLLTSFLKNTILLHGLKFSSDIGSDRCFYTLLGVNINTNSHTGNNDIVKSINYRGPLKNERLKEAGYDNLDDKLIVSGGVNSIIVVGNKSRRESILPRPSNESTSGRIALLRGLKLATEMLKELSTAAKLEVETIEINPSNIRDIKLNEDGVAVSTVLNSIRQHGFANYMQNKMTEFGPNTTLLKSLEDKEKLIKELSKTADKRGKTLFHLHPAKGNHIRNGSLNGRKLSIVNPDENYDNELTKELIKLTTAFAGVIQKSIGETGTSLSTIGKCFKNLKVFDLHVDKVINHSIGEYERLLLVDERYKILLD